MALDSVRLKDNIINRLFAGISLSPADQSKIDQSWVIISEEIVAEIKRASIDVNATVLAPVIPPATVGLPTGDTAVETGLVIT